MSLSAYIERVGGVREELHSSNGTGGIDSIVLHLGDSFVAMDGTKTFQAEYGGLNKEKTGFYFSLQEAQKYGVLAGFRLPQEAYRQTAIPKNQSS